MSLKIAKTNLKDESLKTNLKELPKHQLNRCILHCDNDFILKRLQGQFSHLIILTLDLKSLFRRVTGENTFRKKD